MGFFSGLEGSLEKYIEGFFRDKFRGRVQPLDIAKKLAREMRERKRVSVNLVYAPQEYDVFLHPEDYSAISYLAGALSRELQDYISQKAGEKEFTLVAHPLVKFHEDGDLKPGQIRVSGKFGNSGSGDPGDGVDEALVKNEFEDTLNYRPSRDTAPIPVARPGQACLLKVMDGPLAGKVFRLDGYAVVIGRRESCDITLPDANMSRRHARLEPQKNGWLLTDLDSTNGTFVNGDRIIVKKLEHGDSVKFGATMCAFKVD